MEARRLQRAHPEFAASTPLGATAGIIILSVLAGFAFAKIPRKATAPIYASFVIGLLLSVQSLLIPLFLEVNLLGIYNTRFAVLLVYVGAGLPLGIYPRRSISGAYRRLSWNRRASTEPRT